MTKATILEYLSKNLQESIIDNFIYFTVKEWKENPEKVIFKIRKSNLYKILIIRSSAIREDSTTQTFAGVYESILNIHRDNIESIKDAIDKIIESFNIRKDFNILNQIIIQNQLLNPKLTLVIFTRDPKTFSPYYTIEYDDFSGKTNLITGGGKRKFIRIAKCANFNTLYPWSIILSSIKEIEEHFSNELLNIELALDQNDNVHIFQVRKIVEINEDLKEKDNKIYNILNEHLNSISSKEIFFFSNMADWNPAEMIGAQPKDLPASLYRFLITMDMWLKARVNLGYSDIDSKELMIFFSGKPYIDVNKSLRSLIPKKIPDDLSKNLVNYQIKKLQRNPYLHDKIEFKIAYSCLDIRKPSRISMISNEGFSISEIKVLEDSLLDLTENVISNLSNIIKESETLLEKMIIKERKILKSIDLNSDFSEILNSIKGCLTLCKELGVFSFARFARMAFIGHDIMNQLKEIKVINDKNYQEFFSSVKTLPYELNMDLYLLYRNKILKKDFFNKYGHLRPGTYDITVPRYDQIPDLILNFKNIKRFKLSKEFILNSKIIKDIEKTFHEANLKCNAKDFLKFVKETIIWREKSKFEFTKLLSDSLELLAMMGKNLGLTRYELSHLNIFKILKPKNIELKEKKIKELWNNIIHTNRKKKEINDCIQLPSIIKSQNDVYYVRYYKFKPNFITKKIIEAPIIKVDNFSFTNIPNLENKIIVIEAADPGYDWIFSKGFNGLITKYGGVASHMAIRCNEMGIPAVIGCGEIIYDRIKEANIVRIDSNEEKIIIIN